MNQKLVSTDFNPLFSLAVLGFTQIERNLITSLCRLSQVRLRQQGADKKVSGFYIADSKNVPTPDILVIDADNKDARQSGKIMQSRHPSIPRIMVSRISPLSNQPNEWFLIRDRLGGTLLKYLDRAAEKYFQNNNPIKQSEPLTLDMYQQKACLVVDDSQLIHAQIRLLLQDYKLNLHFSKDAESALDAVTKRHFDLIFLDVMLPGMSGYAACKQLKNNPKTRSIPVVMLTSKKSPFNKAHGAMVGCDKYLTKPLDYASMLDILKQYQLISHTISYDS